MFFWRCKRTIIGMAAVMLTAILFIAVYLANVCRFTAITGVHTYYLDNASSQALQKESLSILDIFRVHGESVYVAGESETFAKKVIEEYSASVLWIENVAGVVSYYCYSPNLANGIRINGQKVNLHVAVGDDGCYIGSPIIFGGY